MTAREAIKILILSPVYFRLGLKDRKNLVQEFLLRNARKFVHVEQEGVGRVVCRVVALADGVVFWIVVWTWRWIPRSLVLHFMTMLARANDAGGILDDSDEQTC